MPIKRISIISRILLIIVSVGLASCSNNKNKKAPDTTNSVSVPTLTVEKATVAIQNEYASTLQGSSVIEIRSQINGYITNILVKEGSYVHKGQVLFEIDRRIYQADLDATIQNKNAASSRVKAAKIELDKLGPLVANNVISKIQLKTAQTQYQEAIASLKEAETKIATAQTNMDYSIIKAPIDGYIGLITKRIGSLIKNTDAEPITVLTSTNTIYAYFSMSELDFHNLYSKLPGRNMDIKTKNIPNVHLKLPDGQIYESNGRISVVTKQIDSTTGSITLRADFPNYNNILLSGGTAKIILNRNITDVIAIPIKAVLDIQDKAFVYVLDKDNKAQQRQIIIGYRNNNFYIIEAGLNPGERIVIDGLNKVSNGTKVINTKS